MKGITVKLVAGLMLLVMVFLAACSSPAATTTTAPATTKPPTTTAPVTKAPTTTAPATTAPATSSAPIYTLKFASYHAATTEEAMFCQAYINDLQTRTNGRVKVDFFPGGSLLTAQNMYDGIQNGIADIGAGSLDYTIGKMPQTQMGLLPLYAASPWIITHALNDFYTKYTPKEFSAVHMMWLWGNGPAILMTTKPVKTLEDLKGMKIRAQGENAVIMKALGGSAQSVAMAEMYDGLSKGVVDGVMVDASVLISFKLGDVTKYILNCSKGVGNSFVFFVVMNQGTWNKLPADIQAIVTQLNTEYVEKSGVAVNREDIDGLNYAKSKGDAFVDLSDAEVTRWTAAVSSINSDYLKDLASKGFTGQEDVLKYIIDRVAYWTTQQTVQKIPLPFPPK